MTFSQTSLLPISNSGGLRHTFLPWLLAALLAGCRSETETPSTSSTPGGRTTQQSDMNHKKKQPEGGAESPSELLMKFSDRTPDSGVSFVYRNGEESGHFSILESLGGGVAALDLDCDGYDDLWFTGGGGFSPQPAVHSAPNGLFRNHGQWRFTDVSTVSGVRDAGYYSHGAARSDVDNDGFPDILVTGYGGLELFMNQGDGTFQKISPEVSGLTDAQWSSSAAWADLNHDGLPDVYVAHYVDWSFENDPFCKAAAPHDREICPPRSFSGLPDILYLNNGDGSFREVSPGSEIVTDGKGLGVVAADLDLDGHTDLYIANDTVPNFLFRNNGAAEFSDLSLLSGTSLSDRGVPDGSMGVDVCDFNNDGMPDVWVVNYERETSALYQNAGNLVFRHVSQKTGINAAGGLYVGWGTCIHDYDLDGDEDLFVSNGHVIRYPTNASLLQLPLLFENESGRRFRNVAAEAGPWFQQQHMGRGAAAADLDNDGDVDLAVSRTNAEATLLANDSVHAGSWVQILLSGTQCAREPVGARLELTWDGGKLTRFWKGGGSYASTGSARIFFGVPDADSSLTLIIHWPGGSVQTLKNIPRQQLIHITEPAGPAGQVVAASGKTEFFPLP